MEESDSYILCLSGCGITAEVIGTDALAKLTDIFKQKDTEIQDGRLEIEKLRVNNEQQCFALEKELQETIEKLSNEQSKSQQEHTKAEDLEIKLNDANEIITSLKTKSDDFKSQLELKNNLNNDVVGEKNNLLQMVDKLTTKSDNFKAEVKNLTEKLSDANRAKCEAMLKLERNCASEVICQLKVKHLEQEKERLTKVIDTLNTEMAQATQAVFTARTGQGHKILDLQSKISHLEDQSRMHQQTKESLQSLLEEREKKIENLLTQLKDQRDVNIQAESQFSHELRSQVKLANLYKASVEESQGRVKDLLSDSEEMQTLLKQAVDDNKMLHETNESDKKECESLLLEKSEKIAKLEREVMNANDLLSQCRKQVDVDSLSPAAAAASNLLKSGKTLTQIYSDYIELSNQLQEEKDTSAKLTLYLEEILKEVEDKAPYLHKQRDDLEKALGSVNLLSQELQKLKMDKEYLENSHLEATRKSKVLLMELDISEKSKSDLSSQVCQLLKEIEILKGRRVNQSDDETLNAADKTVTESIISENLVNFKDIVELQMQNQKLLTVVRELGENRQEEENEVYEKRITELKNELEVALKEIEVLRDSRDKQKEVVTSIIRQRDMYRLMTSPKAIDESIVNEKNGADVSTNDSSLKSSSMKVDNSLLVNLQEEFSAYKIETKGQISTLNEQLEKLKEERIELHLQNSKISSQLEFSNDRFKNLSGTSEGFKAEINALMARNEKLSSLVTKNEEISVSLRKELMTLQENISRLEQELINNRREKTLLIQSEAHLKGEIEALKQERSGQAILLANLQTIQATFEKCENDWNSVIKTRITTVEKEASNLQSKLDLEYERSRRAIEAWEKERLDLNKSIKEQIKKQNETKEELIQAYSMVHELRIEKAALETKLRNVDGQLDGVYSSSTNSNMTKDSSPEFDENLSLQFQEARSTIMSLREQLKRTNDHLIQLKSMSSSLEGELSDQNQVSKKFKEEMEHMLQSKASAISELEREMAILKKDNEDFIKAKDDMVMKNLLENTELQANLLNVTSELESLKVINEALKKSEEELKKELQNQLELLQQARSNYENEMTSHTSILKSLESLQEEHAETCKKLKVVEESAKNADILLEVTNSTWEEKEAKLNEDIKRITSEHESLVSQNQNVLELLDRTYAQVMVYQNRKEEQSQAAANIDVNKEHTEEQMFDVIKYLRNEKDIAVAKSEVHLAENERLSTKVEYLDKRLKETSDMLQESQNKEQVSVTSAVQHAELLRKVELLNVLTDGNRVLRTEKNDLMKQLKSLELKIAECETELGTSKASYQEILLQRDALQVDRKTFEAESRRWQLRAQQLVEHASKMNAEDIKKLQQDKDLIDRQVIALREELTRTKTNALTSENSLTVAQKELENSGIELSKKTQELEAALADASKTKKDLFQMRKIARKYKLQFDELVAQNEKVTSESEQTEQVAKGSEAQSTPQQSVTEAVELAKNELRQEFETKIKQSEDSLKASEEKVKKIRQTAYQRITTLTTSKDEQLREIEEHKTKYAQLEQEKNEEAIRLANLKTEYESCIAVMKNDLSSTRGTLNNAIKEKSNLLKEIEELNAKLSMQQKQLESIQKQLKDVKMSSSSSLSRDSSILAQSSSDVVNPPTANIKPMATPSSSGIRHPHPSSGSARPTPMGRIRPITAVSPATSRTVAVPPTSASSSMSHSQQDSPDDGHPTPSTGVSSTSSVPQATVAPTQAVAKHAVVASVQQIPVAHQSSSLSEDIVSATNTGLNVTGSFEDRGFEAELGESSASTENDKKARDFESSSTDGLSSTTDSIKRPRDDSEIDSSSEALVERSSKKRMCRKEDSRLPDSFPVLSNSSESLIRGGTVAQVQATTSQEASAEDVEEIIVLESDDDSVDSDFKSGKIEQHNVAGDEDVEPDDDVEEYDIETEEMEEGFPEGSGPEEEEEEERFRDPTYSDDNEIVIIDDSESVSRGNDGEQPSEPSESVVVPSQNRRYTHRFPTRNERLPSIGRQHTVPCSSIGPPSGCEDGDSIVPSTPTLFDSRRNDGFAEAISSPQVPSETFLFGNSEQPSQLASQALAMDDTRMDLTQFDDATGRSVPTTPLLVSPLDATISEMASEMLPDTSNASTSNVQISQHLKSVTNEIEHSFIVVPKITVTGLDESTFTIDDDDIQDVGDNAGATSEETTIINPNEGTSTDAANLASFDGASRESYKDSTVNESDGEIAADNTSTGFVTDSGGSPANTLQLTEGNQQTQEQQNQRRTTPIVWDEPIQNRRGAPPSRASPPTRGTPGRSYARRSRPMGGPPGMSRGGAYTYYREGMEQPVNRFRPSRGPRMETPSGRGGRPYSRQRH